MARVLALNNIIRFSMYSVSGSQAFINSFHYKVTNVTGAPPSDAQAAVAFDAAIAPSYLPLLSGQVVYRGTLGQILQPLPLQVAQPATASGGTGTGGGFMVPLQVAGVIKWETIFAGPSGRGRTYLPGVPAASVTAQGIPNAGYLTAAGTLIGALFSFTTVVNGLLGTASLALGLYDRTAGSIFPIASGSADPGFGTMKKRGFFGRPNVSPI